MQIDKPITKREYSERETRGYSINELSEVGLEIHVARKNGIPVDTLRKTKYTENVERLQPVAKTIMESRKKAKGEGKKVKSEAKKPEATKKSKKTKAKSK